MSNHNEKEAQSIPPKKSIPNLSISGNTSIALALCDPLVTDSTLEIVSMPQDDKEESVNKKTRVYIQKCMICKKVGEEIYNWAYNLYREEVQLKQNLQRSTRHQKTLGLGVDWLSFKLRYTTQYNKVTFYFLDIVMPASRVQGESIALTNVSKGACYSLKNHGVDFVKKFQSIPTTNYKEY